DILKYVMPGLIELAAEDKRQGTEMMKTVRNYLKNGRSLRKVSEQLNIHKNTVTYRISKFSELLGIDLDDDDAPLRLGHSLQILEFVDKKRYF
ncbi:MAG: hypothetical protein HGA22_12515, partial [Clostridiales bacterium]|nr:hypothetical protein [Clostridiales bacterium]